MRDKGTFNFSGNLEVKKDAPLEARSLVNSYADLTKPETWTDEEGGVWTYSFMNVTCKDRPGKIYQLIGEDYTEESNWKEIGSSSGSGIEDAPADNKIYGRKNNDWTEVISSGGDSGTFVLETAAADSLTDTEYNDLKDAIEANKIIIADLGLTLGVIAQIYQPCFAATYDSGSNKIVLSLTQTTGTVSSSEDTRRLVVCDIIISGNTGYSVSRDNYNLVNENQVLTFGNTKEYTPTTPYSPATRKYVDDNRYGKTFVVSDVSHFLTNRKETGSAAETATNNIFGSKESFRAVVDDIISNHTRYYIHVDGDANNCIELGCVNAWKNADSSTYQLHFVMTYYTGSTLYAKRISINSDNSADSAFIEIADLVNSDNINVMTKKTTSEYNSLSKNDNTVYFVVD